MTKPKHPTEEWVRKNRIRNREYLKEYEKKNPWNTHRRNAWSRCNAKSYPSYHRYGGRGIKFLMTRDDFKYLWFRDRAFLMKRPSIDRIDNDGNYCLDNCRFVELAENTRMGCSGNKSHSTRIICVETGVVFESIKKAARELNISKNSIENILLRRRKTPSPINFKYADKVHSKSLLTFEKD